jgi:hypothetical protein
MEAEKERSLNHQDSRHVYTEFPEERHIDPLMTNTEQMVQITGNDVVLDGSFRWTSVGMRSSNVFGKANEVLFCVSLYIFNKTAESIIVKPSTTDKTDCCLCTRILQNNNPVRPPHAESDPSFLSRTSFTFGSHIFFTENQRVFRRSFMFKRSGRLSSKALSLIWNITTFSKNLLLPSSG